MAEETIESTMRTMRPLGSLRSGLEKVIGGSKRLLKKAVKGSIKYGLILTPLALGTIALEQFNGAIFQQHVAEYMEAKDRGTIDEKPFGEVAGALLKGLSPNSLDQLVQNYNHGLPGKKIKIVDRNNKTFAHLRKYKGKIDHDRVVIKKVPVERMSKYLPTAAVASEDRRFDNHHAWDIGPLSKAIGIWAAERYLGMDLENRGGSTLTIQVASMYLCDPRYKNPCQDSSDVPNKVRELFVATQLEKRMTKKDLVEQYLNHIYFGNNRETGGHIVGVEMAAQHYFSKSARDLNLLESALLVTATKYPRALMEGAKYLHTTPVEDIIEMERKVDAIKDPEQRKLAEENLPQGLKHLRTTKDRARYVLKWMLKESDSGNFTQGHYKQVTAKDVTKARHKLHHNLLPFKKSETVEQANGTSIIIEAVQKELGKMPFMKTDPGYIKVKTGVDIDLQQYATNKLKEEAKRLETLGIPRPDLLNGVLTVIDSETREVLAFARYFGDKNKRVNSFHIGSTAKPFVTWAYLEQGGSLEDELPDFKGKTFRYEEKPGIWVKYTPRNFANQYTHGAKTTLDQAVIKSHNVPMVAVNENLLKQHGHKKMRAALNQLGLNMKGYWLSAPLGFEVKPLDLAGAYTVFHDGKVHKYATGNNVTFIREVTYGQTGPQETTTPQKKEVHVMSQDVIPQMHDLLNRVVTEGTGRKAQVEGYVETQMGKSGTPPGGMIFVNQDRVLGVTVIGQFSSAETGTTKPLYQKLDKKTRKKLTGGAAMGPLTKSTLEYISATGI